MEEYLPTPEEIEASNRGDPPRQKLSIRTPDELINMVFDDTDCLLGDRLLAKGQPLTILAPGGVGKSRLLLQIIACIVTGREFLGFPTKGRGMRWLILQTENSNRRLQSDLHRIKAWLGQEDWKLFTSCVLIHTIEHEEDGMVCLSDLVNVKEIEELIVQHKAEGVAFDPLNDFSIGDPNKDQEMRDTCRCISKICKKGKPDRAIIVVHHATTGRAGVMKATGYDRNSFGRNSKVLHSWTRGQINIVAIDPDSNERLLISCGKCSNGKEFATFATKLNLETMIYESLENFDVRAWEASMAKSNSAKSVREPTDEDFMAMLPPNPPEHDPRAGLLNSDELKRAFRKRGFPKSLVTEMRGCLVAQGRLDVVDGLKNNEKLCGRPEDVAKYKQWLLESKETRVQQELPPVLPPTSPSPRKRKGKSKA
jgi:hypothetical protein